MFDTIADMLRGSAPDDLAHALGTDRTQTRRAMEIGLPALITGLRDKALEPGGAQNLASMLAGPSSALPADIDGYLSAGDPAQGAAMLDTAFGDRGEPALSALADASGLSTRLLAQVMSVLAPLATGVLRDAAPDDADGLRSYLAGSVDDLEAKGFGRVVELVSPELVPVAESSIGSESSIGVVVDDVDTGATVVEGAFPDPDDLDVIGIDGPEIDGPDIDVAVGSGVTMSGMDGMDIDATGALDLGDGLDAELDADLPLDLEVPAAVVPGVEVAEPDLEIGLPGDDLEADFDSGRGLSTMGWLWWVIGAILALLVLFFLLDRCGGDDDTLVDSAAGTEATAVPTADPVEVQNQSQLDAVLVDYPGVTGTMVSGVAKLDGSVDSRATAVALDAAVRATGLPVSNNVTFPENPEPQGYSINDLIAAQPELSTLGSLLNQAGMGEALDGNGPFTLLAPTNDAFATMTPSVSELQADPELLKAFLQYHMLSGEQPEGALAQQPAVATLQGDAIQVAVDGGATWLNDSASILRADNPARNGVMHIVSAVLVPPSNAPVPQELSAALELAPITFAAGSDELTDGGRTELDKVVAFLLQTPVDVTIGGHTDADGDAGYNQQLSQDRADAVKEYLVGQGVPADSLVAVGFGEDQPIAANDTAENKAKNRRIEFVTG